MASDDALGFDVATQVIAHALRYITVACAMETVAANMVVLVELIRNSIEESMFGHGAMESIIEHNHLRRGGHKGIYGSDTT